MYSFVFVCIWFVFEYIWFLFHWTSMLIAGETWTKDRWTQVESDEDDEELLASRSFERTGQNKTVGCMADGLCCNIWPRAECPAKLWALLWTGELSSPMNWCKGTAENLLGLGMVDLVCKWMFWNGEQAVVFLSLTHAKFNGSSHYGRTGRLFISSWTTKLTGFPAYSSLHPLESTIVPRLTWFWIVWRQSHRS